jgi:UDP-2,3-diacylglucosamine pyrophosphatase LpxH
VNVAYPVVILSDLHIGHPASRITDPEALAPLIRGAATVVFNGDSVEMLWVGNRDHAQEQVERLARTCSDAGARPVFLNGNHDPIISSASYLDLCDGAVLVTHGDILFHSVAPWSREAPALGTAHSRLLEELDEQAKADLAERLLIAKRAQLTLEMHEPHHGRGLYVRLLTIAREVWPPWRALKIMHCWTQTPGFAARLAQEHRPQARYVIIGHTHRAGVWQRDGRVVINTGSFMSFSGRALVRLSAERLEVQTVLRQGTGWQLGRVVLDEKLPVGKPVS